MGSDSPAGGAAHAAQEAGGRGATGGLSGARAQRECDVPPRLEVRRRARQMQNHAADRADEVGIVAIGMTARDAEDPLADQVRERVPNLPRCAFVGQTPGERLDQAIHALGRLEQDGARPSGGRAP